MAAWRNTKEHTAEGLRDKSFAQLKDTGKNGELWKNIKLIVGYGQGDTRIYNSK